MAWTSPRNWVSGEIVTAALLNTHLRDNLLAIGSGWTDYTPTLGGITLGNGTLTARYRKVGTHVDYRIEFVAGSTTSFSATALTFSLPAAATGSAGIAVSSAFGSAVMYDNSVGSTSRTGATAIYAGSDAIGLLADRLSSSQTVSNTVPWTWATSDFISIAGSYEAA